MNSINYVAFKTIVRKEIIRVMRIWTQTLLPSVITLTLYFVIFGSLIGSKIGDMGGFNYIQFIVPGLIMMAVITNSFSNVASSFFGIKFVKSVEELLVSPTSNWVIILGFVMGGVYRGLFVGFLVTLVSLFFTDLVIHNLFVIISVIILTSVLFSLGGFLNALFAKKFDDVGIIPLFVLTPLTYLGGVFYSIQLLPSFWQFVSKFNPILYMVNAFRYGFLGVSDINIWIAFAIIILFIIVLFGFSLHLMNKGYGLRE
jgi:ABC-2 type transport system permease protein